jgi:hypothetical protein
MTTGINVAAGGELGTIELYSGQLNIPPASAEVGGASFNPTVNAVVIAGIIGKAATLYRPLGSENEHAWPKIEISVASMPHDRVAQGNLKAVYEELRRQMVAEGLPFLNATELEREIAERKGIRSI